MAAGGGIVWYEDSRYGPPYSSGISASDLSRVHNSDLREDDIYGGRVVEGLLPDSIKRLPALIAYVTPGTP